MNYIVNIKQVNNIEYCVLPGIEVTLIVLR